jgi:transcriptional regulator with XRE-family HTH domain
MRYCPRSPVGNDGLDMARIRRPELLAEAARRNREQLAWLGGELRWSRKRRRLTQRQLGALIGVVQSTVSQMERGFGGSLSLDAWQRAMLTVDRPLRVEIPRDPRAEPTDAGHLRVQELVLRLGRAAGYRVSFELATRPAEPARSADIALRHDAGGRLVLVECWNTIGDIGAAARSSTRKLAEAESLASGTDNRPGVFGCWVVRATQQNRALLSRYPEVFSSRFPGSSVGWVTALTTGAEPPRQAGLVWCDVAATRLYAWRTR